MSLSIEPRKALLTQPNRGDQVGDLWSTFNIDLYDNLGAIRVGKKLKLMGKTGDTGLTNLGGAPVAFTMFNDKVHFIGGTRVFVSSISGDDDLPNYTFAADASTNTRTNFSSDTDDLCNFNGTLIAINCTAGKIDSLNTTGGTWTNRASISATASMLRYFKLLDRLYFLVDTNKIQSMDTSWVVSTTAGNYAIDLTTNDAGGKVQCFEAASDRIWIGMKRGAGTGVGDASNIGTYCSIYEWDGISAAFGKEYKIPAMGIMAIVIDNDIPFVIDTEGVLRKFNGSTGFEEVGRLPLRRDSSLLVTSQPSWTQNFIHPRGLVLTKDNTILALINGSNAYNWSASRNLKENLPSGIWEFDLKGSAVHRNSFSYMPISSTTVTDYGQEIIELVGSLVSMKLASVSTYGISTLFAGARYYTDATTTTYGIFLDAPNPTTLATYPEGQKYGYFVTKFTISDAISDMWQKVWLTYKSFLDSGDSITVKYRFTTATATQVTITWTSTSTFTTTTDVSALVGYEVEVLKGKGAGKCAHISTVVNNAGTYTVTLDDTFTGATSGTATARIQNWTKVGIVTQSSAESFELPIGQVGERIQIKVCMQFTGDDELFELDVISKTNQAMV